MQKILSHTLIIVLLLQLIPIQAQGVEIPDAVRTANYFLMSGHVLNDPETINTLSEFDLLVLPSEAQIYNQSFFEDIRERNPDILLLAYIPTVSWNYKYWTDPLHTELYKEIDDDWWLKDGDGNRKSVWPNTYALNLNSGWTPFLAEYVKTEILSTGYWDGIFYDEVQDTIDHISPLDVNNDGNNDSAHEANTLWEDRYQSLFASTREQIGNDAILITNGSSNKDFAPYVNGRMFETFPSSNNSTTDWKNSTYDYLSFEEKVGYDPVTIINVNTENTGTSQDYQKMRYGITTTLLGNGFFAFDYGTEDHSQLWTYDEYDAYLGSAKGDADNLLSDSSKIVSGIWERDYENGKVIVNATYESQEILLDGEYEKLHGTQDPSVNNGSIISILTLESRDGIILLRPIEEVQDATFLNGSFARIFSMDGTVKRTGFFAYDNTQLGGRYVIHQDLDHDATRETIVADNTYVTIYEADGSIRSQFAPYTDAYTSGINIAVGDLENDGSIELITGTEDGGGPHVRVFNNQGELINPGFFPYHESFRGGVRVAVGDLNADGYNEIIVAAANGGGPHVRVANKHGKIINPGFFAYDETYRGGAYVSVGDVDGDGLDEIITGAGPGLDPLVRIYDKDGVLEGEFEMETAHQKGINIGTTDVDGNGIDEIIAFTTDVFTLSSFYEYVSPI
jgi:hypothetical protein